MKKDFVKRMPSLIPQSFSYFYAMQAIVFYLVYPILYVIASLPFWALYRLSDVLYYLLVISGYRKQVVIENLRNSFPEKSEQEINALCRAYFHYLCDLTLETFKTMRMSDQEIRTHCQYREPDWLSKIYKDGKSVIAVMGHYGNWEWASPGYFLVNGFKLVGAYRPLTNPLFDKMMTNIRTKFGTEIIPANHLLREMVANRKEVTTIALIADQAAAAKNSYWTTFLNQDTAVFNGPEKLAVKFNYPVVYMCVQRVKRGYYKIVPQLIFDNPATAKEGEILEAFTLCLERDIKHDPAIWLWSHRRWKHKRVSHN